MTASSPITFPWPRLISSRRGNCGRSRVLPGSARPFRQLIDVGREIIGGGKLQFLQVSSLAWNLFGPYAARRVFGALLHDPEKSSCRLSDGLEAVLSLLLIHADQLSMEPKACRTQRRGISFP